MRPVTVIVDQAFFQHAAQVSSIQHNDSVKALTTDGSDHTFCIRVLPRRRRGRHDIVDPEGRYSSFNNISILNDVFIHCVLDGRRDIQSILGRRLIR